MIGVIDTVPENFSGLAGVSFIALLMIAKPHRGHGLGEKVVKMLEIDFTRNHGCKIMRLGVMTNNPGALRFWERLGYRIYKGPVLQPDKTLVVYLQKKLTISRRGRNPLLRFL